MSETGLNQVALNNAGETRGKRILERDYGNLDEARLALYERREGATGEYKSRDTPRLAFFLAQLKTGTSASLPPRPLSLTKNPGEKENGRRLHQLSEKSHVVTPLLSLATFVFPNFITQSMLNLVIFCLRKIEKEEEKRSNY